MAKPLDPGFPYGLLALWLVSELFVRDDLFQLGEHLSPDHHAKARKARLNMKSGLQIYMTHLYDRP
jgi:hypothetical protein